MNSGCGSFGLYVLPHVAQAALTQLDPVSLAALSRDLGSTVALTGVKTTPMFKGFVTFLAWLSEFRPLAAQQTAAADVEFGDA